MLGMNKIFSRSSAFAQWGREESAMAYTEAALLMPLIVTLLMGVYDVGQGIAINQKVISSSQIMGDLIARDRSVTMAGLDDIVTAGELALQPYDGVSIGYDIVSISFDEDGEPEVLWRVTENTDPNDDAVQSTKGLGEEGDGLMIVTTTYNYTPFFSHFITSDINMKEVAFLHGRRSATIVCADCPAG